MALIHTLMAQVAALTARVPELEAKLGLPPKTPDNSSVPPSRPSPRPIRTPGRIARSTPIRRASGSFRLMSARIAARMLRVPVDREHRFRLIVNTQSS